MNRIKEARDKGCSYLFTHLRKDGGFGSLELGATDYYKVPSAFVACGKSAEASQLLNWIRTQGILANGDFGPRPSGAENEYWYAYYNSWVIIGAHRLGQFDIAEAGMDFLMNFWNPDTGGFYSSYQKREPSTMEDLWVVSGCGQAALYTGRIEVAKGVGRWMKHLMENQPNFPNQLYGVYSLADGLITDPDPTDPKRYVLNQNAERDQYFFNPGIAAGFLAKLYQTTGEDEWLELARKYMSFTENATDFLFKLLRAGKVGWAASLLYTLTNDSNYLQTAIRIGSNIVDAQANDGSWASTGTFVPSNDTTAEMVVWLDEIYQAVRNA